MDSLIAKADALGPAGKKRKVSHRPSRKDATATQTFHSVLTHTKLPKSLRPVSPAPEGLPSHSNIANKKLRTKLNRTDAQAARSQALVEDAQFLMTGESGMIETENEMERTWRIGQSEIEASAGMNAANSRREWRLDGGPYCSRYTRNGRHLAIAGRAGHVASFDWQTGQLHAELQLQETCRDITYLHDQSHFAVAQKKYVFIYDRDGVELHCLKSHIEPTRLEFLPYHWLLASVGNAGWLKYQDTSTGQLLVEHRTKMGACTTMTQNIHNAVIHLGHQNGRVTLWTPNLPHPAVQVLAHLGPVVGLSVDPQQGGRYMATSGRDGTVKIWDCRNWKGAVREWTTRAGGGDLQWSAKGFLAVISGSTVNVYAPPTIYTPHNFHRAPPLYLTHQVSHRPLISVRFAPFQDVLTVGHASGLSNLLVPGSGEPNFDSSEADPFETKKARREREVKGLLDKLQPDMITLDPEFVGSMAAQSTAPPDAGIPFPRLSRMDKLRLQGKVDETEVTRSADDANTDDENDDEEARAQKKEAREKKKMRGKGKSLKRFLRKQRKNVVDPKAVAVRAKLQKLREEQLRKATAASSKHIESPVVKPSALDRFKQGSKSISQ
ncbi:BING4CT-domain-containing protein [Fistulina hepatica ATCC 64428]|uniref:U three protein 7 n=1 Tax=Fistulina hepatica ATCC 64428 TaxID=1128425 RepID=A0A0D7AFW6_9AGAR|nr:BING4CT-domain-containing protein [Fistulina hepatica ATCC 64428]